MTVWTIRSTVEPELFWTDHEGFVGWADMHPEATVRFSNEEHLRYPLTIDGEWFPLPETGDMILLGEGKERAEVNAVWDTGFQVELMDREEGGNEAFGFEDVVWSPHDEVWLANGKSRFIPATAEALLLALAENEG